MWLLLLGCLALSVPAVLIDLDRPLVTKGPEALALVTARETLEHMRQSGGVGGWSLEAWVPYLNGAPDWDAPPGATWIQLAALSSTDVYDPDITRFVWVGRLVSAAAALAMIAAVFWAAHSIGGTRTAAFAAVICATNPLFIASARSASPAIFYGTWALWSIAAALWALRPMRPPPSVARQAIGWAICGLAMAFAVLTMGPVSIVPVSLPILLLVLLCPNRVSHMMGWVAALLLATLVVLVWAAYAHVQDPDAWSLDWWTWIPYHWFTREALFSAAAERSGLLVAGLLPWTLWLVAAIVQPFSTSSKGIRTRLFLGWGWFVMTLVFLLIAPASARDASLLAVTAAAAVLVAEVLNQYTELASQGKAPRFWRLLRFPHLALLIAIALMIPVVLNMIPFIRMEAAGRHGISTNLGWFFGAGFCLVLLGLVGLSVRPTFRDFPAKAMVAWSLWAAVFFAGLTVLGARGPAPESSVQGDAKLISSIVGLRQLYWWGPPKANPAREQSVLVLYLGRAIPTLTTDRIDAAREEHGRFYLLAGARGAIPAASPNTRIVHSIPGSDVVLIECDDTPLLPRPAQTAPAEPQATQPETPPAATEPAATQDAATTAPLP